MRFVFLVADVVRGFAVMCVFMSVNFALEVHRTWFAKHL
jgi:hypothetical protein